MQLIAVFDKRNIAAPAFDYNHLIPNKTLGANHGHSVFPYILFRFVVDNHLNLHVPVARKMNLPNGTDFNAGKPNVAALFQTTHIIKHRLDPHGSAKAILLSAHDENTGY